MYSNVYSPEDELEIFSWLFNDAIKNNKKIHIVWVTLDEEVKILEEYYNSLWFMREDINCFDPDFSIPLVTVSVKIENIIWKWSDYKAQRSNIFFNPPIRESWQVKAMFKWINRGVVAWIHISKYNKSIEQFLWDCIRNEKILSLTLAKVLNFNLEQIWFKWLKKELIINY
jgi:dihydroorotase-like cyclic amidohydrolase